MNTLSAARPLSATSDALLRFALRLDATLTGACGLVLAAFANSVATLTGASPTHVFILGAALVLYGVVVFSLAALPRLRTAGIGVIIANLLCTAAAVLIVATGVEPLTVIGVAVALAMGAYTAAFAVVQYFGVRRLA